MNLATLRLFNAIQVASRPVDDTPPLALEHTLPRGYVLSPGISAETGLLNTIEQVIGISGEKANATFHKSWTVVQESSNEALIIQQLTHYLTTYGFQQAGTYRAETVYIPHETLELPQITDALPLTVVQALTAAELLERIVQLGSGVALAQTTLDDIMTIVRASAFDSSFVDQLGNRELQGLLFEHYGIVPSRPVAYLRYLVSKLTGESLLIKNDALITKIKAADAAVLDSLLADAPADLAAIFLRYKPLFLALKSISTNKTFFNRLRKQAVKLHKPLPVDYLNSVTAQIKQGTLNQVTLGQRIARAPIFRNIRLAYALYRRLYPGDSAIYLVRNGRGWVTTFEWKDEWRAATQRAFDIVLAMIVTAIRPKVLNKTIYIPSGVHYALPATEKQFTGNFPSGSYVTVPDDLIVGIHWTNTTRSIDIDLSVVGESGKVGWDASYRTGDRAVLFSGDITDAPAPKGATELFYLKKGTQEPRILFANYYNFKASDPVDCKILVARERPEAFGGNYAININNMVATANIQLKLKQNILALLVNVDGENRVYFNNVSIGNSITSRAGGHATLARQYLVRSALGSLDFGRILTAAGATVVSEKPDAEHIDLSPEALSKNTIIDLMMP